MVHVQREREGAGPDVEAVVPTACLLDSVAAAATSDGTTAPQISVRCESGKVLFAYE